MNKLYRISYLCPDDIVAHVWVASEAQVARRSAELEREHGGRTWFDEFDVPISKAALIRWLNVTTSLPPIEVSV